MTDKPIETLPPGEACDRLAALHDSAVEHFSMKLDESRDPAIRDNIVRRINFERGMASIRRNDAESERRGDFDLARSALAIAQLAAKFAGKS